MPYDAVGVAEMLKMEAQEKLAYLVGEWDSHSTGDHAVDTQYDVKGLRNY